MRAEWDRDRKERVAKNRKKRYSFERNCLENKSINEAQRDVGLKRGQASLQKMPALFYVIGNSVGSSYNIKTHFA